jgi:hypothetical protein
MKNLFVLIIVIVSFYNNVSAEKPDTEKILKEGKMLYRLEKAAWFGTDYFRAYFKDKEDSIGGYLSYIDKNENVVNLFFSRYDSSQVLARFYFDSIPQKFPQKTDVFYTRAFTNELALIKIRQDVLRRIRMDKDDFYHIYPNSSLNLIPIINEDEQKVYILTGPNNADSVLIGNDYLVFYDEDLEFSKQVKLHNSIISLQSKSTDKTKAIEITVHSHVLDDFITATDICTLLLYKDFVEWNTHYVISKNYVSLFNLKNESLMIITREAFDKIMENSRKK